MRKKEIGVAFWQLGKVGWRETTRRPSEQRICRRQSGENRGERNRESERPRERKRVSERERERGRGGGGKGSKCEHSTMNVRKERKGGHALK